MNYPDNTPQWLKEAEISADAEFKIEVYPWGVLVIWIKGSFRGVWRGGEWLGGEWHGGEWHGGVWRGGEWLGGEWLGGEWLGGEWLGGEWRGGVWRGGVWLGGEWLGGVWHGGEWRRGVWRGGVWLGGVWHGGVWLGGVWLGGEWLGGVWLGGDTTCRSKYVPLLTMGGKIRIGCTVMSIEEWDKWFAGKEEFQTKRGTLEFKMIFAHYQAIKAYSAELERKEI